MTPVPRIHGGPDALGTPRHDFSTNSNACGPCPPALEAVRRADVSRYPDASYTRLKQLLADFHAVDPRRVVLAASASEFIFRITAHCARCSGTTVSLPPHAYGDYADAAAAHGLQACASATDASLVWACEPSSPLGNAHAGLGQSVARSPRAPVVLDRAYEPLRLSGAFSLDQEHLDAVWQLWTPNKALGLTGVRGAYAIAPRDADDHIAALDRLCPSWPVGAHGVAMLESWTGEAVQSWLVESRERLRQWKTWQIEGCTALGWVCSPSDTNFFCVLPRLPEGLDLAACLALLRQQAIKLRDTASFGLAGQVRISVQAPEAQDALFAAWKNLENL